MTHRTQHYDRTVYYLDGTVVGPYREKFTQMQAMDAGSVLEEDGLALQAAIRLCDRWTLLGSFRDRQYIYRIPLVPTHNHGPAVVKALKRIDEETATREPRTRKGVL